MRLLLDEQLPQDLRHAIAGHDVITVGYAGMAGLKNGKLLRAAADRGFDALVTSDHNLEYQQNKATLPIAVIALQTRSNKLEVLLKFIPSLLRTLATLRPRELVRIDVGGG